jgi:hypothetical protein
VIRYPVCASALICEIISLELLIRKIGVIFELVIVKKRVEVRIRSMRGLQEKIGHLAQIRKLVAIPPLWNERKLQKQISIAKVSEDNFRIHAGPQSLQQLLSLDFGACLEDFDDFLMC